MRAAEAAEVRGDDPPASFGKDGHLPVPHPGVEGKRVEKEKGAAAPDVGSRRRFEVMDSSGYRHALIVNASPPAVERESAAF